LILASNAILDSPPALMAVGAGTAFFLAFALSGLAMGMGAVAPNFKADNAAKAAAGPGGILFMVLALVLVGAVLALEATPVWFLLRAGFEERSLLPDEIWISVLFFGVAIALCAAAAILPPRRAAQALWEKAI
jgi:hypothetical protein